MPKTIKKCQKVEKRHFGGSPRVQKSTNSRKTGKNCQKVTQKLIKKWSKRVKKGSKKGQKSAGKWVFGGQKSMVPGVREGQKMPFFDMGRVKNAKSMKNRQKVEKRHFGGSLRV
jgi:hypothetical protein